MALITDPDNLNQGTEVDFDTVAKTITLNTAGNLSTDGVTLKALYSFCKEEWKDFANLIALNFLSFQLRTNRLNWSKDGILIMMLPVT